MGAYFLLRLKKKKNCFSTSNYRLLRPQIMFLYLKSIHLGEREFAEYVHETCKNYFTSETIYYRNYTMHAGSQHISFLRKKTIGSGDGLDPTRGLYTPIIAFPWRVFTNYFFPVHPDNLGVVI